MAYQLGTLHQDYYSPTAMEDGKFYDCRLKHELELMETVGHWMQKPVEDNLEMHGIETDRNIGHAYTTDESVSVLDLRYPEQPLDGDSINFENGLNPRLVASSLATNDTAEPVGTGQDTEQRARIAVPATRTAFCAIQR
ncbi:hypothetical protein VSDG_04447 [Cytospora chrysosperma]|uniref:Uncharacterized protein n=1 Tax=Cytospora chrysosperma TaxID=252740 RepID=A0A423W4M9_CYTCH|nr:hypothetical protein VSDG_04447 [Valsa sordida]